MRKNGVRPIILQGHERPLTMVKYNREGDLLFTAAKDHRPCVWYADNGERLGTFEGHSGTVWAIDRSCRDSLIGCVGHIDGLPDPHCHTVCSFTWEMGPGGVANFSSGGTDTLTHHLPSPGIALVQQLKTDGKTHNDRGCGDAGPRA